MVNEYPTISPSPYLEKKNHHPMKLNPKKVRVTHIFIYIYITTLYSSHLSFLQTKGQYAFGLALPTSLWPLTLWLFIPCATGILCWYLRLNNNNYNNNDNGKEDYMALLKPVFR